MMNRSVKQLYKRALLTVTGSAWMSFPKIYRFRTRAYNHLFGVGTRSIIESGVWIHCTHGIDGHISFGDRVLLARNVNIDYTGFVDIEDDVWFSEGSVVHSHIHSLSRNRLSRGAETVHRTCITFRQGCWIGGRAIILPRAREIGQGAIVAAGAVVSKPVEPYTVVAGNPARIVRRIEDDPVEVAA